MKPPTLAHELLVAATAPSDYESVAGDLEEEYASITQLSGRACADHWYWSQALRSLPSLLSFSRTQQGVAKTTVTIIIVVLGLAAMLMANELIEHALATIFPTISGVGSWLFFLSGWLTAACFGALIAAFVRLHSVRIAFFAATSLIVALAVPIALGFSSPLVAPAWILVLGAIPAMCIGAGAYQITRRHQ